MKFFKLILMLLLVGCTSSKIVYDYDVKLDFNKFQTFNFYDDVGEGLNELDVKRILSVIEKELLFKGFKKSETPDFLINFTSLKTALEENNNVGIGIGGGRNVGFGISGGINLGGKKINEELTIEFVNAKNNQLFWQGISNKKIREKIKPEAREIYVKEIVKKIFEKYPPQKK
ncbi:MAG: DUF4136 domain-containing protein [Flavobacteriaceae bacterium]